MSIRTRLLDKNGDRLFGNGKANYNITDTAIVQNVKTRLRSLKDDFFLDADANIAWFEILGELNNQSFVFNEIYRVANATDGVLEVTDIQVLTLEQRSVTISITLDTINNKNVLTELGII